jgi:hypothetical protein
MDVSMFWKNTLPPSSEQDSSCTLMLEAASISKTLYLVDYKARRNSNTLLSRTKTPFLRISTAKLASG